MGSIAITVAQLGQRRRYAVPRALYGAGVLSQLYTDIVWKASWPSFSKALPPSVFPKVARRLFSRVPLGIPNSSIRQFPALGLAYAWRRARARTPTEVTAANISAGEALCKRTIQCGIEGASAVYGFSSSCLELLDFAKRHGLFAIVDQTSAPREVESQLLDRERELFPDWSYPAADLLSSDFAERVRAEWDTASVIVCGAEFVKSGIQAVGGPVEKCVVVPHGGDFYFVSDRQPRTELPLRVLFVGNINLQKGVPYLLKALHMFTERELRLRLVGAVRAPNRVLEQCGSSVEFVGHVPYTEIAPHFAWADVFVFPSLCEGSAAVTYEALASGLPVITTPNAGSVVRDGVDGFIVPIRNAEAIAEKLGILLKDHQLRAWMSTNALQRSRQFTLDKYGKRLLSVIRSHMESELTTPLTGAYSQNRA